MSLLQGTFKDFRNLTTLTQRLGSLNFKDTDYRQDVDDAANDSDELDNSDLVSYRAARSSNKRGRESDDDDVDDSATKKEKMENGAPGTTQTGRSKSAHSKYGETSASRASVKGEGQQGSFQDENVPVDVTVEAILDALESVYVYNRGTVVGSNNYVSTPLHALKIFGEKYNETYHAESMSYVKEGSSRRITRVELFLGEIRGVGEAFTVRMAKQMAAIDVLMKAESLSCEGKIPAYAIVPGWRISPRVQKDLWWTCNKNGLQGPHYIPLDNVDDPEKPASIVKCYIGRHLMGVGQSDLPLVAHKLAAAQALEFFTEKPYPLDYVALGDACSTYEELVSLGITFKNTEFREQWLLNESAKISNVARGVDLTEMEAVQEAVYQRQLEAAKEEIQQEKLDAMAKEVYQKGRQLLREKNLVLKVTVEEKDDQSAIRTVSLLEREGPFWMIPASIPNEIPEVDQAELEAKQEEVQQKVEAAKEEKRETEKDVLERQICQDEMQLLKKKAMVFKVTVTQKDGQPPTRKIFMTKEDFRASASRYGLPSFRL